MDSRLQDMLHLVSRVHEKRGDIRVILRQDPTVQREVHSYLDDLVWLTQRVPINANADKAATSRARLLATVRGQEKPRRKISPLRLAGATASMTLLFTLIGSTQAATHNLPEPVYQVLSSFPFSRDSGDSGAPAMKAGTGLDGTLPTEKLDAVSPGFSN